MLKLFDRYILKEIIPPFFLGLLVYTFVLLMNQILLLSEMFIARGVALRSVLELLIYLIPSMLAFTVPMSVLMGVLAGLSRMSSDSEITAFKTLGVDNQRLLRPVLVFSLCGLLVTAWLTLYLAPHANYKWVQTLSRTVLNNVQFRINPREFNESIPETVIFVQDIAPDKTWQNIFVHVSRSGRDPVIIFARSGQLKFFPDEKRATLELFDGASHSYSFADPERYTVTSFARAEEELEVSGFFASYSSLKRVREKDINELMRDIPQLEQELEQELLSGKTAFETGHKQRDLTSHWVEVHKKFALPCACLIFALLGISLGASTRKGGRTSGFTISIVIIIIYYVLITAGENMAMDGRLSPWVGMWGPNILLFVVGLILFIRTRHELSLAVLFSRWFRGKKTERSSQKAKTAGRQRRPLPVRFPNILDRYILRKFLAIFLLVFFSMLAVFIIITFFERIDTVYQHNKSIADFFRFIWYKIPDFVHQILPVTGLAAALLSLGILTKFNEITAMKTCGISLYRTILPVLFLASLLSFVSFYLQENVLPYSNKKAEETWDQINDIPPRTSGQLDRRWVLSKNKARIFHYRYFDPISSSFSQISVFDIDPKTWELKRRIFAEKATLIEQRLSLMNCWSRLYKGDMTVEFENRTVMSLALNENKSYFLKEWKEPDQMRYGELKRYIADIEERGFETVRFKVDLNYKLSFPLSSLIMVILGIPFAFSMGKRGTLFGLGLSVVIGMFYWGAIGIFKSLGYANFLNIFLAAWGPNILFGLIGLYLLFTLRT